MKKLNDIRKNEELYKVPENYFDEFQARMSDLTSEESTVATVPARSTTLARLAYALPAVVLLLVVAYWSYTPGDAAEDLLADISTDELIEFLEQEGISEDELISLVDIPIEELEKELEEYSTSDLLEDFDDSELEEISEEIDLYEEYL